MHNATHPTKLFPACLCSPALDSERAVARGVPLLLEANKIRSITDADPDANTRPLLRHTSRRFPPSAQSQTCSDCRSCAQVRRWTGLLAAETRQTAVEYSTETHNLQECCGHRQARSQALTMATPYGRRAKAGPRKTLSSRLGFRYGRSASAAGATGAATGAKSFGSASSPIEPRVESETSASTLQSSPAPAPLGERQGDQPRETRSFTVAVAGDTHSRFRRGDELQVAGTGGQIRVSFEKEEFSSTGNGKALGLTVSPAKEGRDGLVAIGAKVHQLPGRAGAVAGKGSDSRVRDWKNYYLLLLHTHMFKSVRAGVHRLLLYTSLPAIFLRQQSFRARQPDLSSTLHYAHMNGCLDISSQIMHC